MEERIQKLLSAAGVCSRRAAERYIEAGRVTVNGEPVRLGDRADWDKDEILVDGKPIVKPTETLWLMLNKPRGYVTTLSDEKSRRTAAELIADCGHRLWPVGRLDLDSEGLLLFTNDGEGTNRLLHPSHEVEKEYRVTVRGDVIRALPILESPMELEGQTLAPAQVRRLNALESREGQLSITIHEGKNRQVRRMCAMAGLEVRRLKRVREGSLRLGTLPTGKWRWLTEGEVRALLR